MRCVRSAKGYQPHPYSTMPNAPVLYVTGTSDDRVATMRRGLALSALLAIVIAACTDAKTHVYSARAYDAQADCLSDYAALDVVPGDTGAATCAPVCLVSGATHYVSTVCAPYPSAYVVYAADASVDAATDAACQAAIAALASGKACGALADAGIEGGGDGGREAVDDGGGEAGDDGGSDAAGSGG